MISRLRCHVIVFGSVALLLTACGATPTGPSSSSSTNAAKRLSYISVIEQALPGDPANGKSLSNVRVEVVDGPAAGTIASPFGSFYELKLEPGAYRIRLSLNDYYAYETQITTKADPFSVPFLYMSRPPFALWGGIYMPPDSLVEILDGPNAGRTTTLDANRRYLFTDLAPSPEFRMRFGGVELVSFSTDGNTPSPLVRYASFSPPSHSITGRVQYVAPIAGAVVQVVDGLAAGLTSTTDVSGFYHFDLPTTETVHLRATAVGFDPVVVSATPTSSHQGPTIFLGARLSLTGEIRNTLLLSTLVAGARVVILTGPNSGKVAITNAAGTYTFADLTQSPPMEVAVTATGYLPMTQSAPDPREGVTGDFLVSGRLNFFLTPIR